MKGPQPLRPAAKLVVDLLAKFPKASKRAIARRLQREHPAKYPNYNSAYCAVRLYAGARGDKSRVAVQNHKIKLPKAIEENWEPFAIDARRVLLFGDIHIPFHSSIALNAILRYGDTYNPDAIFINGDLFDFYQISKFDRDPTLPKVADELLSGGKFFDHLKQRFPRAKLYFKLGNHDERWDKYLFVAAPLIADVPGLKEHWQIPAGIVRNGVTVIGDKRPVMLGKLPVLHGHELEGGATSPVNPARGAFIKTNHTVFVNHHHRTSAHGDNNMFHDEMFGWSNGCCCGLSPPYKPINKWNWGFATVEVYSDSSFDVQNMRIAKNGKVRTS